MAANRYKVPKKQWAKWSPDGQSMFNHLYAAMGDRCIFPVPERGSNWKTTRWNAAWLAASATSRKGK